MSFTDIFIKRPVFATVVSLLLLLIGTVSYFKLPVRQYPKIDATVITVQTFYPGASAQLMEAFVTSPIESVLSGINGIDYITADNTKGESRITLHFQLGTDLDAAASDVSSKVNSVRSELPTDAFDPVVQKNDPDAEPIIFPSFYSSTLSTEAITDYMLHVVAPQIGTLPGVSQVPIFGERRYAMRVGLNPNLMAAHNVTLQDISTALATNNVQSSAGQIESKFNEINLNASTDLKDPQQFNNLIIRNDNGNVVRIKDVGSAQLGAENTDNSVISDGKNSVILGIIPQPNANPLDVSKEVKAALAKIDPQLPQGLHSEVVWDSTKFISASIHEVKKTVFEAALVVVIVIFLFLGSLRVLAIPAVTIPLSVIGVCSLMLALGFSINTLTLLAIVLAIGMVVDDAIVVAENIHRHLEAGTPAKPAAMLGAREIQFAIIAMTFTLAAVFAPIGFMGDITGSLFKEFAFTLAMAVIVSGFIALTLSPMMCSKIMNPQVLHGKLPTTIDYIFKKIVNGYRFVLTRVVKLYWLVAILILGIAISVPIMYLTSQHELAPAEDEGAIMTIMSGPPTANLDYTQKYSQQLESIYNTVPEKQNYVIINGWPNGVSSAISFLVLKPWEERHRSVEQIIPSLFPSMWGIAGMRAFPVNPFNLPGSNDVMPVKFILKTTGDYHQLADTMNKLIAAANKNPGLMNIDTDMKFDQPQINVDIDRNKAADLGISMSQIGSALNVALGEPVSGYFEMNGQNYDVIPQLQEPYMNATDAIYNINLRTASGALVPLSNLVKLNEVTMPESLYHFQQQRAAALTASLAPGYSLGQALQFLQTTAQKIMPSDMQYDFSGTTRQFTQAGSSMEKVFVFAIIFIFLVLAAQFESFLDPLIVMFSVIPAIAGALLALKLTHGTINIYTQIGLVTLIGLISKHGILMVEFANQLRKKGKEFHQAIVESACIRFRPILMTTACMVLGAVPLALASGAGAMSRQQMGWVILGGMSFGTCVTLFVVPTAYVIIKQLAFRFSRKSTEEIVPISVKEITEG